MRVRLVLSFLIFALGGISQAGECRQFEKLQDRLSSLGTFDLEGLKRAKTLSQCLLLSNSSAFRSKYIMKFENGDKSYIIIDGSIEGIAQAASSFSKKSKSL